MTPSEKAETEPSSASQPEKKGAQTTKLSSNSNNEEMGRIKYVKGTRSQIFVGGVRKPNPRA